jgi:putative flippase GtrA
MGRINWKITPRKIRFSLISSLATAIDFSILLTLTTFGLPLIVANLISTSISFVFSFFGSKKFAFRTADHHISREAVQFIVVTLFGIWIIQPLIIWPAEGLLQTLGLRGVMVVVVAKLTASLATFFWNYLWYTRLVFKKIN